MESGTGVNGRALTRWTADTEIAFLLALEKTGCVAKACAMIGRSAHGASDRRKRLPDFAAQWQAVLDARAWEVAAAERAAGDCDAAGLMPNRERVDGWTPKRQRAYLAALRETGAHNLACREVGISQQSSRAMRRRFPSFAAACDLAIARGAHALEDAAFSRAIDGWEEPIMHGGQVVGHRRRFSDSLVPVLLAREDKAQAAKVTKRATSAEVDRMLTKQLDILDARLRREAHAKKLAWTARMEAEGKAP